MNWFFKVITIVDITTQTDIKLHHLQLHSHTITNSLLPMKLNNSTANFLDSTFNSPYPNSNYYTNFDSTIHK